MLLFFLKPKCIIFKRLGQRSYSHPVRIFLLLYIFESYLMQNSNLDNFQKSYDVYGVFRSKHKGLSKAIMWRTSLMQKTPVSRDQSQIRILIACKN